MQKKIAIIGAGASGCMAAIVAAKNNCIVTLFETNDLIGKKILATGNGRCNISNNNLSVDHYYSESDVKNNKLIHILDELSFEKTRDFFKELGLYFTIKESLAYPKSGQAQSVVSIIKNALKRNNISVRLSERIKKISVTDMEKFVIKTSKGLEEFDSVIIATGGISSSISGSDGDGYYFAKQFGHTIVDTCPALVQLKCDGDFWKQISGVRCEACIALGDCTEYGELQITDYGISGFPVFQLSLNACRKLQSNDYLEGYIDFLPDVCEDELKEILSKHNLQGLLNPKLAEFLFEKYNLNEDINVIKKFRIIVNGHNGYKNAQVTSGGVSLAEVDTHLQSLKYKGLYFTGEVLDITGKCGGYNLQWAWSSGYTAGMHASKS